MVQVSKTTFHDLIPKRYLRVDAVLEADKFDRVIGSHISILYKFGVASYPDKKSALFFDYCQRINLKVNSNPGKTLIWLDGCEEGVIKILSGDFAKQCSRFKYGNIQKLIGNGNR